MKVGLYLATQFTAEAPMNTVPGALVEQVRRARQCGFASLWTPHHYLTHPMQMLQPTTVLAYLLTQAEGMTVGTNILVMPLLHPVHVAEEAVTFDLLSGGRYVLGIGIGYRQEEFNA